MAVPAGGVQNAQATTLRPDMLSAADGDARGINIFLYQVTTNAALAGNMLPVRRGDGSLLNRPEQALDLHYLLTFSGDEKALEPQRMLDEGMHYSDIEAATGASSTTISRVSRALNYGADGYRAVLGRLSQKGEQG